MQASILPKRAVREAQKLGVSTAYLSGGVFRAALCWMRRCRATFCRARRCRATRGRSRRCRAMSRQTPRCRATFFHQQRYRAAFGRPRRYRAAFGHSWAPKRPFIARQRIACPNIAQNRREHPGFARLRRSAQLGSARQRRGVQSAIVRHSVRHSAQLTFAGIRPLQQKSRNIIPVFVLCNADSVIGCFSSMSGYLSGQFTYNAPLNEKTRKRSV